MSRGSGYYWVSSLGLKPEIAEWDSSNNTWQFIGAEGHFCGKAIDEDPEFKVVSTRILTPDEERKFKVATKTSKIKDCGLSNRSVNTLCNAGVNTVAQLAGLKTIEFTGIQKNGVKSMTEIVAMLDENNINHNLFK